MTISARSERGSCENEMPYQGDAGTIERIGWNAKRLITLLKSFQAREVCATLTGQQSIAILTSSLEPFKCAIMPIPQ
jgi:hypothetical protein